MAFEQIVGNEKVKKLLNNIIKSNNILHSYIFQGQDGIGKLLFAKEFAKIILCENQDEKCTNCTSCVKILSNNHPDFYLIEPDEKGSIKIEQIRQIIEKSIEKPIVSQKKVYIINDSHKMTKEAQNCLLKTLEEPSKYLTIILITSNEGMLLNTIKSRCMKINFEKLNNDQIKQILKLNQIELPESLLDVLDGSMAKINKASEQEQMYTQIKQLIDNIENDSIIATLKKAEIIYDKENIKEILDYINILLYKKAKDNIKYANCIEIVEKTKRNLEQNGNLDMNIDNMLLNIKERVEK